MLVWTKRRNKDFPKYPDLYIISIDVGNDNMDPEDYEAGFVGYLNWYADEFVGHAEQDCGFKSSDSGMFLYKEKDTDGTEPDIEKLLPALLRDIFENEPVEYTIIDREAEG